VITNPFLDDRRWYDGCGPWDFTLENFCQVVLLKEFFGTDGTITLRDYHRRSNLSRNLARARGAVTVRETSDEAVLDVWWALHRERHEAVGATSLPMELFGRIQREIVRKGKGTFLGAFAEEGLVAGAWYIHHGETMDVFMLSASDEGLALGANFLLTDISLQRARETGVRWYNWQSSPSRTSGVYRFKAQWGSHERTYAFITRVVGDISAILAATEAEVREAYRWHYVLPFSALLNRKAAHVRQDELGAVDLAGALHPLPALEVKRRL
jgi:hypothetical protein